MALSALDSRILGPLLTTPAMAAVFAEDATLAAMLHAETALARALAAAGMADAGLPAALDALDPARLDPDAIGRGTAMAGVPVIPFVQAVQACLPAESAAGFHRGATTQDIADTALVLQVRAALDLVREDVLAILDGLVALARAHRETPCVGRTYGQHGAPVTFGYKVAVWLAGLAEVAARLPEIRADVLRVSLAGPVGTLAALGDKGPVIVEAVAAELGLSAPAIAWHTRRASMVALGSWLATLVGALGKMAGDVSHLMSTEVGEVAEPHIPGRGGSSAMPHKRNPVSCTVILAAAGAAPGHVATLLGAMVAAHERPAGAWHAEWHALPSLFGLAAGALREARALATGLTVDAARMRSNIDITRGLLFADAVAARLARDLGRARAHALVEAAASAVRDGAPDLATAVMAHPDRPASLAREDVSAACDLGLSMRAGALWADRAIAEAAQIRARLASLS